MMEFTTDDVAVPIQELGVKTSIRSPRQIMPYQKYGHMNMGASQSMHLVGIATWLLFVALAVSLIRLVWKMGDKK